MLIRRPSDYAEVSRRPSDYPEMSYPKLSLLRPLDYPEVSLKRALSITELPGASDTILKNVTVSWR